MPSNVVKHDARVFKRLSLHKTEKKWDKAKSAAKKQGHTKDWPYVQSIYQKMTQKYKKSGPVKEALRGAMAPARGMGTRSRHGYGRGARGDAPVILKKNQSYNQKFKIKKMVEDIMNNRKALRNFIMEKSEEIDELTVSGQLAIPANIGGANSDEDIPPDVHDHEVDDTDDTQEDERTGNLGIKPGSGAKDPNA